MEPTDASRTGSTSNVQTSVQASDSASSSPMLAVPGWRENQRLPNAADVVREPRRQAGCKMLRYGTPTRYANGNRRAVRRVRGRVDCRAEAQRNVVDGRNAP